MKKSKATLDALSAQEQRQVFEHLEKVKLVVGKDWLLAEWDIQLSEASISKWLEKKRSEFAYEARIEKIRAASNFSENVVANIGKLGQMEQANLTLLSQALFDAQLTGDAKTVKQAALQFAIVCDVVAKNKRADAAVELADTAMQKFRFDAAKVALAFASELKAIHEGSGTEMEKVNRAVEKLFGTRPPELPQ